MKISPILILTFLFIINSSAQKSIGYLSGAASQSNLNAVESLSPYSSALGFDNRYLGVKGTTRLLDTLVAASLLIKGNDKYIRLECDIDVVRNALMFRKPAGDLMEILSEHVDEVILHNEGKNLIFKTTESVIFEKKPEGNKFYQVLNEGNWQFIKIPDKKFVAADYKRLYSPDIRYDEYRSLNKYYIMGTDSVFHRVQLTRRSLIKLFPSRSKLINAGFDEKSGENPEDQVIRLLEKF